MSGPKVSVILNCHSEGRLAFRSAKSAKQSIAYAEQRGLRCELVAVLDRPTADTVRFSEENRGLFDKLVRVEFGDLGLSRNAGIAASEGEFVAFLDADDIYSENWLYEAYQYIQKHPLREQVILHTEYFVGFGSEQFFRRQIASNDPSFSPLDLIENWFFCNNSFASRQLYIRHPFSQSAHKVGLGAEDWLWSCESLALGCQHDSVPGTAYFYRRRADIVSLGSRPNVVYGKTRLFEKESKHLWNLPTSNVPAVIQHSSPSFKGSVKSSLKQGYRWLRSRAKQLESRSVLTYRIAKHLDHAMKESVKDVRKSLNKQPPLPAWLIDEMRRAHDQLEPELFPDQHYLDSIKEIRPATQTGISRCYAELFDQIGDSPDLIILAPWLKHGGADRLAILYANAVASLPGSPRVTLITTEPATSPWKSRLHPSIRFVELGLASQKYEMDSRLRRILLLRILLQRRPKVIWSVNSFDAYEIFCTFGAALSHFSKLVTIAYGPGLVRSGQKLGSPYRQLPRCFDHLSRIVTDNRKIVDSVVETYAFDPSKFQTIYAPTDTLNTWDDSRVERRKPGAGFRFLWAGRLDFDKRIDVLYQVLHAIRDLPVTVDIYGQAVMNDESGDWLEKLKSLPNARLRGPFDAFEKLPTSEYDAFLYTTNSDGMPNVLLEAAGSGLPIIAPKVGGIPELVSAETGFLIQDKESAEEYAESIRALIADYPSAIAKAAKMRKLLEERHSISHFANEVGRLWGSLIPPLEVTSTADAPMPHA